MFPLPPFFKTRTEFKIKNEADAIKHPFELGVCILVIAHQIVSFALFIGRGEFADYDYVDRFAFI